MKPQTEEAVVQMKKEFEDENAVEIVKDPSSYRHEEEGPDWAQGRKEKTGPLKVNDGVSTGSPDLEPYQDPEEVFLSPGHVANPGEEDDGLYEFPDGEMSGTCPIDFIPFYGDEYEVNKAEVLSAEEARRRCDAEAQHRRKKSKH